jgi:hypothetical protein
MKVKIGNLEITDVTPDELDELVKRYGGTGSGDAMIEKPTAGGTSVSLPSGAADTVLLKKLVEAGAVGLTTIEVGDILGRRGKATRPALTEWATRIGLTSDENLEPFEDSRVGTQRGLRLKSSLLDVARHLMSQK